MNDRLPSSSYSSYQLVCFEDSEIFKSRRFFFLGRSRRNRRRFKGSTGLNRRISSKAMSDHLPCEVVVEILLRLPARSLMSCRCVCREWYSLISCSAFITLHTNRALSRSDDNNESNVVLFQHQMIHPWPLDYRDPLITLRSDDGSFGNNSNFIELYRDWKISPRIVGSCNGLLCLVHDVPRFADRYELWNPFVNKILSLPEPDLTLSMESILKYAHGFGCDPSSNEIKLVRLVYVQLAHGNIQLLVEIYSLNSGHWRAIAAPGPSYMVGDCLSVFVNGASHWVAHTPHGDDNFRSLILAFDMGDEVFREIAVPNCFTGKWPLNMALAVRDGLLCLVPHYPEIEEQPFSIWIMKEYGVGESWTKLFNIHMQKGLKRVVGFRKNGEVLVTNRKGMLVSYEPNTQQVTHLGFRPRRNSYGMIRYEEKGFLWEKYMETILLLDVKNGVSEGPANTSDS